MSASKYWSIISVWFLDKLGSITFVSPTLLNPASKIEDLTWAEAIFDSYVIPFNFEPLIFNGALFSLDSIFAPIKVKGSIILFIGRLDKLLSPNNSELNFCPDKRPVISLIVVPELPQSRAQEGADKPFFEFIKSVLSSIKLTSKPKFLKISRVEIGSFPFEKFEIFIFPPVREPKIIALWEIDLSDGIITSPLIGEVIALIFISLFIICKFPYKVWNWKYSFMKFSII